MAKMTGVQGIKVREAVREALGDAAAEAFESELPLSKSADYIRKFKWAKGACEYLEKNCPPEKLRDLRMACACQPPEGKVARWRKFYADSSSLDEFCAKCTEDSAGDNLVWREGDSLFLAYPRCFCGCVQRVDEPISQTWCLCTLGYAKALFDHVLDADTEVELLESVKMGHARCTVKIGR